MLFLFIPAFVDDIDVLVLLSGAEVHAGVYALMAVLFYFVFNGRKGQRILVFLLLKLVFLLLEFVLLLLELVLLLLLELGFLLLALV